MWCAVAQRPPLSRHFTVQATGQPAGTRGLPDPHSGPELLNDTQVWGGTRCAAPGRRAPPRCPCSLLYTSRHSQGMRPLQSQPPQEGKAETLRRAARPGSRTEGEDIWAPRPDTRQGPTRLGGQPGGRGAVPSGRPRATHLNTDARGHEVSPALRRPGLSLSWWQTHLGDTAWPQKKGGLCLHASQQTRWA